MVSKTLVCEVKGGGFVSTHIFYPQNLGIDLWIRCQKSRDLIDLLWNDQKKSRNFFRALLKESESFFYLV